MKSLPILTSALVVLGMLLARADALQNLATSGTASASSQGYGSISADGNDGNRDGAFGNGSVFHTNNEAVQSFWQVQLPGVRYLDHVRIFNRVDAIQGSVGNFRIIARNGATTVFNQVFLPTNATDNNNSRAWGTDDLRGVQADFVRIERISQATNGADFLTFAEVEVWGSATPLDPFITPSSVTASAAGSGTAVADANDGDISGNSSGPGVPIYHSAAQGVGQFWEMTLPTSYLVKSLLIFNRCEAVTTTNVRVKLLDAGGAQLWSQDVNLTVGAASPYSYGFELSPNNAARRVRIETLGNEFLALAEVQVFGTPVTVQAPVVVNGAATGVTASTATLAANVTSTGFEAPTVRIYHGTTDGGTTAASWANVANLGIQSGAVTTGVTGLAPGTAYFFRAFAQNSAGSDWADSSATFTTGAAALATLEIVPAIGTTGYTALLNGRVISTGNDAPAVTLYWGASDGGTSAAAWANSAALGAQSGAFGAFANGLSPSTIYFFRAAAVNATGATWTPARSFTTTTKPPVVINEIHYKPADRTKNIEFIELWNPSAAAVSVAGWRLLGAVDYVFPAGSTIPAGGYRVLAANSAAFQAYYGFAPFGQWLGTLKNSGETIELRDAANVKVDDVDFAQGFPWPTSAAGDGPSIELIHPALENDLGGAWRSSTNSPLPQTPGAVNSISSTVAPPAIRDVAHTPNSPLAAQAVVITARVEDTNGVASVALQYQAVDPGAYIRKTDAAYATTWTTLAMNDAGTDGDTLAGDGIFSATIPAIVQTHRRLVRYRITATDSAGTGITVPYADDEQPNFAYFVYNGIPAWTARNQPPGGATTTFPTTLLATMPTYHLLTNETDVINSQYNGSFDTIRMWGTLVYDGKVYDHILYHNKGSASTYQSGKNKWRFRFNRARDFEARDSWGKKYGQTWDTFTMHACASPWNPCFRGWAGLDEIVSTRIYQLAGVPSANMHHLQFRVVRRAVEAATPGVSVSDPFGPSGTLDGQYSSDMWGLYMAVEDPDGSFLDERGLPDGSVYHIVGNGGDKTHQGATHPADISDWNTFIAASQANTANTPANETWWRANLDVAAYASFHAGNRITGNVDLREGWNHYFYHRASDNRWLPIPWDIDMMYFPETHWSGTIDQKNALLMTAISVEYKNRCRELLDLICENGTATGGQIGQLVDEYKRIIRPAGQPAGWDVLDQSMWNYHPRTAGGHTGRFYLPLVASDNRIGGTWTRTYATGDFNGICNFLVNYVTDTDPNTFAVGDGDQRGYGYNFLELDATDAAIPGRPTITYSGAVGFPANDLRFNTSAFADPQGAGTFAAMQWRVGEISAPGVGAYVAGEPFKYEAEDIFRSAEITPFAASYRFPVTACEPGHTYRARVRSKDNTGRWSRWSPGVQFTASTPDVSVYTSSLVVSEVSYNPSPATAAEIAAGFGSNDFEWMEVKNVSALPVDMTGVRFTKGADFDFPNAWTIPPGGFALVVQNLTAFQMRYGASFNAIIAGSFPSDHLSNSGEQIKLSYGVGTAVVDFTYTDAAPWPVEPDGTGRTLVLKAPHTLPDHALATSWRASLSGSGSPGADDGTVYSSWKTANGITDEDDDRDDDGLTALLEYFTGSNPALNARTNLPTVARAADGTLTIVVTQAIAADDVTFTVETSTDLTGWAPAGVILQNIASIGGRRSFTYALAPALPPDSKRFVRVKITTL